MSGVVNCPTLVTAITLGDGAHSPTGSPFPQLTDGTDDDVSVLVSPYNAPHVIVSNINGTTTISMPPNVTSITINSNVYTPDGTQYNIIAGPDADMTNVIEQGFQLVDELS